MFRGKLPPNAIFFLMVRALNTLAALRSLVLLLKTKGKHVDISTMDSRLSSTIGASILL